MDVVMMIKANKFQIGQKVYFYGLIQEVVAITADSRTGDQETIIVQSELSKRKQEVRVGHWGLKDVECDNDD